MKQLLKGSAIFWVCIVLFSCQKVDIPFSDNRIEDDPNVNLYENYEVALSTYKIDSFITSGHSIFTLGHHIDTLFGTIHGSSFAELNLPSENPVQGQLVSFDSLVIILRPNGSYYGDTLQPFQISAHRVLQKIENEEEETVNFYNSRSFAFDASPLGQLTTTIRPQRGTDVRLRISDAFGLDLLNKFRTNSDTIQDQKLFIKYLKGIYLRSDSLASRALYYFKTDSAGFMRLHYTLQGTVGQKKYIDFTFNSQKQFNNIRYHHSGTSLSVFTPLKKQLKASSLTDHRVFLNSNMGSYIKINFPSLLGLKETHPYINVLKAELIIKPRRGTYKYPYQLPSTLYLHATNNDNELGSVLTDATGQSYQTGSLVVDDLYGENTYYHYDLTSFVNAVLEEGSFSKLALMMASPSGITDSGIDRLVLNDNSSNQSFQLKLYVLGL